MKRKNLKTKISLGTLMACLITGNIGFAQVSIAKQDGTESIIKTGNGSYIAGEIFDGSTGEYKGSKLNVDYKGNLGGIVYGTVKNYDELNIVSDKKGIHIEGPDVNIENVKTINITSKNDGIFISNNGDQSVTINNFDNLNITTTGYDGYAMVANGIGGRITVNGGTDLFGNIKGNITLATNNQAAISSGQPGSEGFFGIGAAETGGGGDISITSKTMNISSNKTGIENRHRSSQFEITVSDKLYIDAKQGITASAARQADKYIGEEDIEGTININAGTLEIKSKNEAILASNGKINVTAPYVNIYNGTIGLSATKETFIEYRNIDGKIRPVTYDGTGGEIILSNVDKEGNGLHNIENNGLNVVATEKGINAVSGTIDIDFIDSGVNIVVNNTDSDKSVYGLYANNGNIDINTNKAISIGANIENITLTNEDGEKVTQSYGRKHSIKAEGGSDVDIIATGGDNKLYGVVYAKGDVNTDYSDTTTVTINHGAGSGSNYIYSSAHGSNDAVGDRQNVVAALYAQNKGQIDITAGEGGINRIETYYEYNDNKLNGDTDEGERTVWAQRGGIINITGTTIIQSSNDIGNYENGFATNNLGIAINAGTGELKDSDYIDKDKNILKPITDNDRSKVDLQYGIGSKISGDIVAGYGGDINISRLATINALSDSEVKGIEVRGNALAANGGKLNLDLGEGSIWYGRADDYQDAGQFGHGSGGENSFFNPVFSNDITSAGDVTVTLGKGSQWSLTGQSWITTVNGVTEDISDADKPVIDIANSNVWLGEVTSTALTIGTLNGNVRFNMHLDGNELENSDMIYIKNAKGEYDVSLNEAVTTAEINNNHDGLRFATVGKGSNAEFRVGSYDSGFFNVEYEVGTDLYEGNKENVDYNGGDLNEHKPGDDSVKDFFEDEEITTLNEITEKDQGLEDTTNFKIIGRKGEDLSDGGKTVVNMSKVNYSNAVYMDRLNKRLGEARYINTEEEQGMWVRMRHDRIGKDNEFRIMNTMYELGYDEKQECDNGERRVGAAIDYMDGSSEYTGVGGSGDVSRKGIWLYDTWLGDKGHYSDFVAKWGHLSNDFTLYKGTDKITGDFSNNVYSISAEYGRKKDIGNNWYFEPQVQLQYARVTDANYTTSQGTEVSLDAINSLIARAGFRLGKDLGERSTVYFKADLLHEFLGDQDIAARDKTTDGKWTNVTYGNEGTWCDIGFGFATAMSKTSYAYLDVETSLGNDYEETYQINAGLQWSF